MPHFQPKIMVVDDDPGLRLTLEGILEDEGFDVVGAEDGYQAIELAKQSHFDLIFMDIKMPVSRAAGCWARRAERKCTIRGFWPA